jgi:quercetin dioxygenase-like cupin family protein
MARPGDTIDNPVTGERMVFRSTGRETGGELLDVELQLRPTPAVAAAHLHALQEEDVEVLEGTLRAQIGGREQVFGPGERVVIPAGTAHAWSLAGSGPARARLRFRPALDLDAFFEDLFALARAGRTDANGNPGLLHMLVLARRHDAWAGGIPLRVQRATAALVAPIARLLGVDVRPSEAPPSTPARAGPRARA